MGRNYDHHWKKGRGKAGVRTELPSGRIGKGFDKATARASVVRPRWDTTGDTAGRLDAARRRLGAALGTLAESRESALPILQRAGAEDNAATAAKLARAYRERGMVHEAMKVRAFVDAYAEVFSARQSIASLEAKSPGLAAEQPTDAYGEAVAELAGLIFPDGPPTTPQKSPRGDSAKLAPGVRWRAAAATRIAVMPPVEPWHRDVPPWEERPIGCA